MTAPDLVGVGHADDQAGPRLLRGGPIATEVRAAVAADVIAFREEHGFAPALAVVIVGSRRALDRLPAQDPRRLPDRRHRRPARRAPRGRRARTGRRRGRRAQRGPDRRRDHRPDAAPALDPAADRDRRPRPGQGHRRDPSLERRPARARLRGLPAGDGARGGGDPEALRDPDRGSPRRGGRPLQRGRQAGGAAAPARERDGHGLPLADGRPGPPGPRGRDRGRRRGPARAHHRRHAPPGGRRRRRRHQRARRPDRRRRRLRIGARRSSRRSRRSPAASAR